MLAHVVNALLGVILATAVIHALMLAKLAIYNVTQIIKPNLYSVFNLQLDNYHYYQ